MDPVLEHNLQALAGKYRLNIAFTGRSDGALPRIGELNPDIVMNAVAALADTPDYEEKDRCGRYTAGT